MKRLIMIIGEPGSGKSTLVKAMLEKFNFTSFKHKILRGYHSQVNNKNLYTFGIYFTNEIFEGTDKLSMGVQPSATDFMLQAPEGAIFITEGDRLGNGKLLNFCQDNGIEYSLIHLSCDNPQKMRDKRGSMQTSAWIESRQTKIRNLTKTFDHVKIQNQEDKLEETLSLLLKEILK